MEFLDFFRNLFQWSDFMPHGHCYLWRPSILLTHVISDSLISLSYYSIPVALVYFVLRRRDLVFRWVFVMFGVFILACGTTHVLNIVTVWTPVYRLDGLVKAITAVASIGTAVLLWPIIPSAISLPSPQQMQEINSRLRKEIAERIQMETALRKSEDALQKRGDDLESAVRERTEELQSITDALRLELRKREEVEEDLRQSLLEKEILVREVHHRVKNNLQIISSIMNLQTSGAENKEFFDLQARIQAMSLVHDLLHKSGQVTQVLLSDYLNELMQFVTSLHGSSVTIEIDCPDIRMRPDSAIYCGLIANELVTNSLKHAFREGDEPRVFIRVQQASSGTIQMDIADSGSAGWKDENLKGSFGLKLVSILVDQMRGTMVTDRTNGTLCRLTFVI